jgi:hypothetical protein
MTIRSNAISVEEWEFLRRSLGLSLLQTEIVRRLFQGKSCQEIAREMAIQPRSRFISCPFPADHFLQPVRFFSERRL